MPFPALVPDPDEPLVFFAPVAFFEPAVFFDPVESAVFFELVEPAVFLLPLPPLVVPVAFFVPEEAGTARSLSADISTVIPSSLR